MSQENANNSDASQTPDGSASNNSEETSIINGIWQFLRRSTDLPDGDVWPCLHIRDVAEHLIPTVSNGSRIPAGFVEFLATDFCSYDTHLERVDHISFYVGTTEIRGYSPYWLEVLLRILIAFCGMRRLRVAGTTLRAMQHHLGGFDCIDGNTH